MASRARRAFRKHRNAYLLIAPNFLLLFAFIPARYDASVMPDMAWPGGWAADVWTFITYALLHANLMHLVVNSIWLAAFGTPLARRFGLSRFLFFSACGAAAGALAHLAAHPSDAIPLVGASAAISAHMAAVCRFAFDRNTRFLPMGERDWRTRARPLVEILRDRRVLGFLAAWFAVNLLFGLTNAGGTIQSGALAWEAHIGGFVFGLLAFRFFDPVRAPEPDRAAP
jgi:membrane associated rhomboid family serine protease